MRRVGVSAPCGSGKYGWSVGANRELRRQLDEAGRARGFRVFYPEMALCTDNGAMIAFAGALRLAGGSHAGDGAFAVKPRWPLSSITVTD